jgi:hypothetical protein
MAAGTKMTGTIDLNVTCSRKRKEKVVCIDRCGTADSSRKGFGTPYQNPFHPIFFHPIFWSA